MVKKRSSLLAKKSLIDAKKAPEKKDEKNASPAEKSDKPQKDEKEQKKTPVVKMNRKRIFVVMDERPYLHALTLKLKNAGYEAAGTDSGKEALEILKKEKYDLLLLDLIISDTTGFTVLEEMGKSKIKTPTMIVTTLSQKEDKEKVTTFGIKQFFEKTESTIVEIIQAINSYFHL